MNEADIPPDSSPPINARQGLLFEYVSALACMIFSHPILAKLQVVECVLGAIYGKS